ncbi:MAG: acetolactate synthase large subunit [Pseudomonadales bacterium]|nr:acetolactate synthase large subunit [Pseudomonadales bacterium]MCP5358445.1 acetolactate synthase large subunit [Pseudomonadales bacterium]
MTQAPVNGASALLQTLVHSGVDLCIANPGTSEMHLVQAMDQAPGMRPVLALFEGVCTGAADGYGRMLGRPAATLLHLGPGLANGIANLHNARKAGTPLLNIVGNHPHYHMGVDAPLTSDIDTLAHNFSAWTKSCSTSGSLAQDGADAVTATLRANPGAQGQIATLIVGADAAWGESNGPVAPNALPQRSLVDEAQINAIATDMKVRSRIVLLLEHHAVTPGALEAASRISSLTGARLMTSTFPARIDGGPGAVQVERMPYFPEQILATLDGTELLVLVGGQAPASFFAYQGQASLLVPAGCRLQTLARIEDDAVDALNRLATRLGAGQQSVRRFDTVALPKPQGSLNTRSITQAIAACLPEGAIVATDSGGGNAAYPICQQAAPHTWLSLTGGSIGQGGPVATGAALACPDRPVLALLGDGGAAYTIQCLWTQARENLNVTTVIYANRQYNILNAEYARLGITDPGPAATSLFDISNPEIDWVAMAGSFGVPGAKASSAEELCRLLERSVREPGPFLIQAQY